MMPVCRFTWKNLKFKYLLLCDIITILLLFATQKHLEGHPAYIMVDQMLYTSISLYFIGTEKYFQGPPNFSLTQEQPRAVEVILEAGSEQEEQGSCEDKHPSTTVTSTQSPGPAAKWDSSSSRVSHIQSEPSKGEGASMAFSHRSMFFIF